MKLTCSVLFAVVAGGTMLAQVAPTTAAKGPVKKLMTATKPAAAPVHTAVKHAAAPEHVAAKPKPAPIHVAAKPANGPVHTAVKAVATPVHTAVKPIHVAAAKPVTAAKAPVAHAKEAPVARPAVAKAPEVKPAVTPAFAKEESALRVSNRRDPFLSPIVRETGAPVTTCAVGKRCLVVDQIQLKGIVKSENGYIAVVENPMKRAYFLRENDPIFNGSVVKITFDSVTFREETTDKMGKPTMREVVKKVNAPVV